MTDEVKIICEQCNDTHQMPYGETRRLVPCTRCPVPCQDCRSGGTGAFCETTPCKCNCHSYNHTKPAEKFVAAVKERKPKSKLSTKWVNTVNVGNRTIEVSGKNGCDAVSVAIRENDTGFASQSILLDLDAWDKLVDAVNKYLAKEEDK